MQISSRLQQSFSCLLPGQLCSTLISHPPLVPKYRNNPEITNMQFKLLDLFWITNKEISLQTESSLTMCSAVEKEQTLTDYGSIMAHIEKTNNAKLILVKTVHKFKVALPSG